MPKETIHLVGEQDTGKTVFLAQMIAAHPDQPIYFFDNERKLRGTGLMVFPDGKIPDNVIVLNTPTLPDARAAIDSDEIPEHITGKKGVPGILKRFKGTPEGEGIIMVDMISIWWERAQEQYVIEASRGKSTLTEHLLEIVQMKIDDRAARRERAETQGTDPRKQRLRGGSDFEGYGGGEWKIIKAMHSNQIVERLLTDIGCHIIATSSTRDIRAVDNEFPDAQKRQNLWSPAHEIAEGEKYNDHRFATIMNISRIGGTPAIFKLSLLRDRGRKLGVPAKLFYDDELATDEAHPIFDIWQTYTQRTGAAKELVSDG